MEFLFSELQTYHGDLILLSEEGKYCLLMHILRQSIRFERRIYIPLPDTPARTFLLEHEMKKTKHDLTKQDFEKLGELTDGYNI